MNELVRRGIKRLREDGVREFARRTCLFTIDRPNATVEELNKRLNHARHGADYNTTGFDIFEQDWDNLVLLDACRFDAFREHTPFSNDPDSRISRGSNTREFIRGNFRNRTLLDTVYVSDNPWYHWLCDRIDSSVYHFCMAERDSFDGRATHPSRFTTEALSIAGKYPRKRLIIHYLQPHPPYFNVKGEERRRIFPSSPLRCSIEGHSREDIWNVYTDNLRCVLDEVQRLVENLCGRTAITADHGELLGDRMRPIPLKGYNHPEGVYAEPLVQVPWQVREGEERKRITTGDDPQEHEFQHEPTDESVREQLKLLGYR